MPLNISGSIVTPQVVREYEYNSIIQSGLVCHLDARIFNTVSGTTWYDFSGNGKHGTLTNGPTFDSSNQGSIVLDGTNDYVVMNTTGVTTPSITVSMWVNFYVSDSGYFYVNENSLSDPELRLSFNNATGKIGYALYDAGAYFVASDGSTDIIIGNWYNITMAITNSQMYSYINGVLDKSASGFTYNGNSSTNASNHILGTQYVSGYGYGGYASVKYGNFLLYNKVLSTDEIQHNYNLTKHRYGL